jgi:hypothetical protein
MIVRRAVIILLAKVLLTVMPLAACTPLARPSLVQSWQASQVRLLDPADASDPGLDLIAVYTRAVSDQQQIRLDFLDLPAETHYDLYLALDSASGGVARLPIAARADIDWDTLLVIPAHGEIQVLDSSFQPRPGPAVLVLRDPVMDTVQISFNDSILDQSLANPLGYRLQVFVTPPGSSQIADQTDPLASTATPPAPAPFLLAFWDSLPAFSPVQALRRWDGAHTGPQGGRHGLYNLLRTARATQTPLVLLDLKSPDSLVALEYVGGLGLVRSMSRLGLLELPQVSPGFAPGNAADTAADPESVLPAGLPVGAQDLANQDSRQAGLARGLPASLLRFDPLGLPPQPGAEILSLIPDQAASDPLAPLHVQRSGDQRLLVIPAYDQPAAIHTQATLDGPSLKVRKALLAAALSPDPGDLVMLGGDLPASTWGNPQNARATFKYLREHPWMLALSGRDLLSLPVAEGPAIHLSDAPQANRALSSGLQNAPSNQLGQAAWQAFRALYDPVFPNPPQLGALRRNYLPQVQALLSAAQWASAQPAACDGNCQPQASCQADPDGDGQPECVFSSPSYYAIFELQGGYLSFAFTRDPQTGAVHQWIGPSSQFASGLSPAESWNLSAGVFADPGVYPGAFYDWDPALQQPDGSRTYQARVSSEELQLTSPDGSRQKTFHFSSQGLSVQMLSNTPTQAFLPLALDPWQRYTPGWTDCYQGQAQGGAWHWSVAAATTGVCENSTGRFAIDVQSGNSYQTHTFLESLPFLDQPEDPNRNYPAGHFLPFPLAVAQFGPSGQITLQLNWTETGP